PGAKPMNGVAALARECEVAMQAYLAGGGEAALRRAYEAGRRALADGMGVLDILAAHQAPIIRALQSQAREPDIREPDIREPDIREPDIREPDIREPDIREPDKDRAIERALHCLAESLSPFEMVFRGVQEANARL